MLNDVLNAQGFAMHYRAISNRGNHFEVFERVLYFSVPYDNHTRRYSWRSKNRGFVLLYLFE